MSCSQCVGDGEPDPCATGVRRGDRQAGSDEHGSLAHAPDAVRGRQCAGGEAAAVVSDGEHGGEPLALESQFDGGRVGVTGDVRECLLRDPVDDELLLGREGRSRLQLSLDGDPRLLGEGGGEGGQGTLETEVIECVGAQPTRDLADLLGPVTGGLAKLVELLAQLVGDLGRQPFDLEDQPRQRLPDLVVELPRDPAAFGFLKHQRAARAVASLGLEPLEHLVERASERGHVGISVDLRAGAGRERIVAAHRLGELIERAKLASKQEQAHGE
jgi:hypothetical protein